MTQSEDIHSGTDEVAEAGWAVDSPAVGTGLVVAPCGEQRRPAAPPPADAPVAVTLSGGGFRATLAGVGVLRLLGDAGLLPDLRYLSSVSGGSVANGLVASAWPRLREDGFTGDAVDRHVVTPLVQRISGGSLKRELLKGIWRTIGPMNRTELLARQFDEWFFDGLELERLDPQVRWILNAANLTNGVRFTFERDVVGDYVSGLIPTTGTGLRLSTAAAASAAVPGAFAPLELDGLEFPCARWTPVLMDGGTYDNTGLQALDGERYRDAFLVCLNAGGLLRPGPYGRIPIVRDLARANSLLYRQSTALRTSAMVDRFKLGSRTPDGPLPEGARRGVLTALASDFPDPGPPVLQEWRRRFPEHRTFDGKDLALVPTVFDRLDPSLCRALVYRGWWLTGAALATFHPGRLGDVAAWVPPAL